MISQIVVDTIIKHIIQKSKKLIRDHKIDEQVPKHLKFESMNQIKSAINIYQIQSEQPSIPLDDQEYEIKPCIDSFQALTLKLIDKPIIEQSHTLSVTTTQKSMLRKYSYKKKTDVHVQVVNIQETKKIEQIDESFEIYKKSINTNNQNRHSIQMKQQIKELTKHMYIDDFDPNQFRKKIQQQAEMLEKEMKQVDRSFQVKRVIDKSFEVSETLNQTLNQPLKPSTAPNGQRKLQYKISRKIIDLNVTVPQFKRQATPVEIKRHSKQRNVSLC